MRTLIEVWLGHVSIERALQGGRLRIEGSPKNVRGFREWFALSSFAQAGREQSGQAAPRVAVS